MKLTTDTIDSVLNKKYTEFSSEVRNVLLNKMNTNIELHKYKEEIDKIHSLKDQFQKINNIGEE